MSELVQRL